MLNTGGGAPATAHRDFITRGLSILVASRDADNRPVLARACGCTMLDDGTTLVFVHGVRAAELLECVALTGAVAAVFSEPETHRTLQLKASGARVIRDCAQYETDLLAYRERFAGRLTTLGYSAAMARNLVGEDVADYAAVAFVPTAVFDQTPGPNAGAAIDTVQ